jgi:hypothetical protein
MEKRHEQFGSWLESQDIPEELRLQVESWIFMWPIGRKLGRLIVEKRR